MPDGPSDPSLGPAGPDFLIGDGGAFMEPAGYSSDWGGDEETRPQLAYSGPNYHTLIGTYPVGSSETAEDKATSRRIFDVVSIGVDFYRATSMPSPSYIDEDGDAITIIIPGLSTSADPFNLMDSGLGYVYGTGITPDDEFRMEGHLFEKRILSAYQGLPTLENGFLDTNSTFISKIQQVYGKYMDGSTSRNSHDTHFNIDFGFDSDTDGIPFEDYYTNEYRSAPWSSFSSTFTYLARFTAVSPPDPTFTVFGSTGEYSIGTDYRDALTEVFYSTDVRPLKTYNYFYDDLYGEAPDWEANQSHLMRQRNCIRPRAKTQKPLTPHCGVPPSELALITKNIIIIPPPTAKKT